MNLATFRVEGRASSLDGVVQALGIELDGQWRAGDRTRSGNSRDSDGFTCTVADAGSTRELETTLREFSSKCLRAGLDFRALELRATLSVGLSVGDSQQFVASLVLPADLLASLGHLGLAVEFNAYPTSDGANAT